MTGPTQPTPKVSRGTVANTVYMGRYKADIEPSIGEICLAVQHMSNSDNYRAIAYSSILRKLLDLTVLDHYHLLIYNLDLRMLDLQTTVYYGIRRSHGYYVNNGSTVYCVMLEVFNFSARP